MWFPIGSCQADRDLYNKSCCLIISIGFIEKKSLYCFGGSTTTLLVLSLFQLFQGERSCNSKDPRPISISKMHLPENPRPTAVTCISQPKRMWKARTMSQPYSVQLRKAKPDTHTVIWNIWKPAATPLPICLSALRVTT